MLEEGVAEEERKMQMQLLFGEKVKKDSKVKVFSSTLCGMKGPLSGAAFAHESGHEQGPECGAGQSSCHEVFGADSLL